MTDGKILKSDVIRVIENRIREIHLNAIEEKDPISQLYKLIDKIEKMPIQEANWVRDADGAWKCTHCGYRFFNGTGMWKDHCPKCGYHMKG